ncbi:unnamed protein product [Orchesella dallaii]|uniref:F-box domain-containing protein n=1 Tax=Orchesella dallaii TaxID=48710 RepID=A0ABP1S7U4_9HEXA
MILRKAKNFAFSVVSELSDVFERKSANGDRINEPSISYTKMEKPGCSSSVSPKHSNTIVDHVDLDEEGEKLSSPKPGPSKLAVLPIQPTPRLLPEIWEKIFSYLTPSEYINAINANPEWREIMKSRTPSILLPFVLPILVDTLKHPHKPMLAWRGLNQEVKSVLDEILEENSTSIQKQYESHTNQWWSTELKAKELEPRLRLVGWVKFQYIFRKKDHIHKFLRYMGDPKPNENPIMSKSIYFNLKTDAMRSEPPEEIYARLAFLSRFGDNISDMTCSFSGNIFGESLRHFVEVLKLVPNVKILHFCNSLGLTGDQTLDLYRDIEFPRLRKLELLDVELFFEHWMMDKHYSLIRLILRNYGPQLKILFCAENFFEVVDTPLLFSHLPNLQVVRLRSANRAAISILTAVNWRLQEIQVCNFNLRDRGPGFMLIPTYCIRPEHLVKAEHFYRMLNNFKNTLVHVQINLKISSEHFQRQQLDLLSDTFDECPNVVELTASFANIGVRQFWLVSRSKFPNVQKLNLFTTGRITAKKVHYANRGFEYLRQLERIRIWCAKPGRGEKNVQVLRRNLRVLEQ